MASTLNLTIKTWAIDQTDPISAMHRNHFDTSDIFARMKPNDPTIERVTSTPYKKLNPAPGPDTSIDASVRNVPNTNAPAIRMVTVVRFSRTPAKVRMLAKASGIAGED